MKQYLINNQNKIFDDMIDNSTLFICSGEEKHKSADENYPFCVNKNFYYLTGLDKPLIYLILTKINGNKHIKIFSPRFQKSQWVTPEYKLHEITKINGIEDVEYYDKPLTFIPTTENIYTDELTSTMIEDSFNKLNSHELIAKFRSIKTDYEIKQIQKAINITHKGLLNLFNKINNCNYEYQAQALFEGEIKYNNSQELAFATICASGKNACTLHYSKNTDKMKPQEMLLLDLGAKFNHFSADISRTIPYKKKFTELQKTLYNMVLETQKLVIKAIKPGITVMELNNLVIDNYFVNLKKMNLVKTKKDVKKYYMHSVGHSLGMDTHDEGFSRSQPLVKGNIITVEPGIYIPKYKIGIRIEDDVLVTEKGAKVLSKKIPKTIEELEKIIFKE